MAQSPTDLLLRFTGIMAVAIIAIATLIYGLPALEQFRASTFGFAQQQTWIDPQAAPSPVRLSDSNCLNLHRLPIGWKVTSASNPRWANFGVPGKIKQQNGVAFDILVGVGDGNSGDFTAYRDYVEQWTKHEPPKAGFGANNPAWNVPGFKAYPADDGEIVYVGKDVDATMECTGDGCSVHDGIERHPIAIDFWIGIGDRPMAKSKLDIVRHVVETIKVAC
jgi:hypothetical protein